MDNLHQILQKAGSATWDLAPYVVFGVLLGEALRYTPATRVLERICRQRPVISLLFSAVFGMASPLCTYGTVPVVLELLRAGVPIAPLATFLATSSLMNPQLLVLTWGGLGAKLACVRLAGVLVFGLILGAVLYILPRAWSVLPVLTQEQSPKKRPPKRFTLKSYALRSWHTLEFVGFYVLIGVLLGAVVEVVVPGRWILALFGSGGWTQILLASLLGVPLYACGGGAIPLVRSLLEQGLAPGAAMAFLIAGPASRLPPLMALGTILRPAFVVAYVCALVSYSVLVGIFYGWI